MRAPLPPSFARRCRFLHYATLLVLGVFVVLLLALAMAELSGQASWHALLDFLLARTPMLFYLWALWAVQRALQKLAQGQLFHLTLARALRQVGVAVLLGALFNVFALSNLMRMLHGGHGGYATFDPSGMVLGVVGAALIMLAQVIDQARKLQRELEEIF